MKKNQFLMWAAGLFMIAASQLAVSTSAEAAWRAQATTALNFRAGPGTRYQVIGTIPRGGLVTVFHCTGGYGWCDVDFSGIRGWASGRYLAYAGGGRYSGRALYSTGVYIGVPIIRRDYPIYGRGPYYGPRYGRPGYYGPRYGGPRYGGPRYGGPRYDGPRYGGPGHRPPRYAPPRSGPPRAQPPRRNPRAQPPRRNPPGAQPGQPGRPWWWNRPPPVPRNEGRILSE